MQVIMVAVTSSSALLLAIVLLSTPAASYRYEADADVFESDERVDSSGSGFPKLFGSRSRKSKAAPAPAGAATVLDQWPYPTPAPTPGEPEVDRKSAAGDEEYVDAREGDVADWKEEEEELDAGDDADFTSWPLCPECGEMLGRLLQGLREAGYVKSSLWVGPVLRVELNQPDLYGEIATKSRLPRMWKLTKRLKFTVKLIRGDKVAVNAEGLSMWGPEQALELYKKVLEKRGLDGQACVGSFEDFGCIKAEMDAAKKFLDSEWDTSISKDGRKITRVMATLYSSSMKRMLWLFGMSDKLPTFFYSLITAIPRKIETFEFEGGAVSAASVMDPAHPSFAELTRLNLFEKAQVMSAKSLLETSKAMLDRAQSQAPSGSNLARMLAFGSPTIQPSMKEKGIAAGDPAMIGNLMAWCKKSEPGSDPQCEGKDPGRVSWGSKWPATME